MTSAAISLYKVLSLITPRGKSLEGERERERRREGERERGIGSDGERERLYKVLPLMTPEINS
jgi:hypothetical protein